MCIFRKVLNLQKKTSASGNFEVFRIFMATPFTFQRNTILFERKFLITICMYYSNVITHNSTFIMNLGRISKYLIKR